MHVSEGVGFLVKVFREAGSMTVASEGFFVFFESSGKGGFSAFVSEAGPFFLGSTGFSWVF